MWLPMCSQFVQYSLTLLWEVVFNFFLVQGFSVSVNYSKTFAREEDICEE